MFYETRKEEFDKLNMRLQVKLNNPNDPEEVKRFIVDIYTKAVMQSNDLAVLTLQSYHVWLMKKLNFNIAWQNAAHQYDCLTCGSTNIERLGFGTKAAASIMFGFASSMARGQLDVRIADLSGKIEVFI